MLIEHLQPSASSEGVHSKDTTGSKPNIGFWDRHKITVLSVGIGALLGGSVAALLILTCGLSLVAIPIFVSIGAVFGALVDRKFARKEPIPKPQQVPTHRIAPPSEMLVGTSEEPELNLSPTEQLAEAFTCSFDRHLTAFAVSQLLSQKADPQHRLPSGFTILDTVHQKWQHALTCDANTQDYVYAAYYKRCYDMMQTSGSSVSESLREKESALTGERVVVSPEPATKGSGPNPKRVTWTEEVGFREPDEENDLREPMTDAHSQVRDTETMSRSVYGDNIAEGIRKRQATLKALQPDYQRLMAMED